MKIAVCTSVALAAIVASTPLYAQSPEQRLATLESQINSLEQKNSLEDRLRINGFMTFAMERTGTTLRSADGFELNYRGMDQQPGVGTRWDTRRLNRAGVQFNARIDERTEAVLQLLARGDQASDYDVTAQWAYIGHDLAPTLTARAGRMAVPFYLHSQYIQVGYAYPWIELPIEVYARIPQETYQGADLTWRTHTGPVAHSVNAFWGHMDVSGIGGDYTVRNMTGMNVRSHWNNWSSFVGYTTYNIDLALPFGLALDNHRGYFTSAGVQYDNGRLMMIAEQAQLGIDSPQGWFPKSPSTYILAGYRFGKLMPHITWAQSDAKGDAACADGGSNGVTITDPACFFFSRVGVRQKSWTFGARYDLTTGVALKAEATRMYDFTSDNVYTSGRFEGGPAITPTLTFFQPPANDDVFVYRLAVEATF